MDLSDTDKARSLINTFLDSPIIQTDRDEFLTLLVAFRVDPQSLRHRPERRKVEQLVGELGDRDLSCLDPDLYQAYNNSLIPADASEELRDARSILDHVSSRLNQGLATWSSSLVQIPELKVDSVLLPGVEANYNKMRQHSDIVDAVARAKASGQRGIITVRSGNLVYTGDQYYGLLKMRGGSECFLVTFTQVLMLKDMYYGRFNALLACTLIYKSGVLYQKIEEILEWALGCLTDYGNKGYEVVKSIEPLAKVTLIKKTDSMLGEHTTYGNMLEGLKGKERSFGRRRDFHIDRLAAILDKGLDWTEQVETFGLQKLSGHPLVDPRVGGRSVQEELKRDPDIRPENIARLRNNAHRLYLEGFVRARKEWPHMVFTKPSRRTRLFSLYSSKELYLTKESYPLSDWDGVRFGKHADFDYYPNFTDLMDDKALSFYREEAATTWDKGVETVGKKRLLLEMLSRKEFSVRKIVDRVRSGDIPYSWLIVTLYPKEREFKLAARMFSMMVLEMRAYFTACEANTADYIFPYLPPQTMTLSKQKIQELFHKITEDMDSEKWTKLYLEVDLTRWNLRWKPWVVDPIGQMMDDIFGLEGVYTAIHHFFKQCLILIRVPSCRPDGIELTPPKPGPLVWTDHDVGFEGIAQKTWTICTYSMIDLALWDLPGKYYLLGQADNQIVITNVDTSLSVSPSTSIREVADNLTSRIEEECSKVGQEAKQEECLQSSTVITYSKNVYINGVEYFTSVKAFSRVFPHSSSDFPSLASSLEAISSQCVAAAEQCKNPLVAYSFCVFSSALYLVRLRKRLPMEAMVLSPRFQESLTARTIVKMLLVPGMLGGFPVAPVTSFIYKGGADPLSKAYAALYLAQGVGLQTELVVGALHSGEWFETRPDSSSLLDDPYGLPLKRPRTALARVYRASKEMLHSRTQNIELKQLSSMAVDQYDLELTKTLLSISPFNPTLASDIRSFSIVGVKNSVAKMFTETRTIQALLQGSAESDVVSCVLSASATEASNILMRLVSVRSPPRRISDIYRDVESLREKWRTIENRLPRIVGVTSYTPFQLTLLVGEDVLKQDSFRVICRTGGAPIDRSRGPHPPYLGQPTREKRASYGYRVITSSAPERAVKRLINIATQPGVHSSFEDLLASVALTRADIDLKETIPMVGRAVGGSIGHRYSDIMSSNTASGLGSMSVASHCLLYTDRAAPISGGERDVAAMIQEMMVFLIGVVQISSPSERSIFRLGLSTRDVDWEFLDDTPVSVASPLSVEPIYLRGNSLATVDTIYLRKVSDSTQHAMINCLNESESSGVSPIVALRSAVYKALSTRSEALSIADHHGGTIPFNIDILELKGIGLTNCIRAFSTEIALETIEALFGKSAEGLRWTPAPMISSLAEASSATLSKYIYHPMIQNDPMVRRLGGRNPLKYSFSGGGVKDRLRSALVTESLSQLSRVESQVYTEVDLIFRDSASNASSRLGVRRLKALLFRSISLGEVSSAYAFRVIRQLIPSSMRAAQDEVGRMNGLLRLSIHIAEDAAKRGASVLKDSVSLLVKGRFIKSSVRSAMETIRQARQNVSTLAEDMLMEHPEWRPSGILRMGKVETLRFDNISPLSTWRSRDLSLDKTWEQWSSCRMRGRRHGGDSSVGYSYLPVAPVFYKRVCYLVGCGYGSGLRVMALAGASMVFYSDLLEDLNDLSLVSGDALPPAVSDLDQGRVCHRASYPESCGGRWDSGIMRASVRSHLGEGGLLVLDYPILTAGDLIDCINGIGDIRARQEAMVRLLATTDEINSAVGTLVLSGVEIDIYPIFVFNGKTEVWLHLRVPHTVRWRGGIAHMEWLDQRNVSGWQNARSLGGSEDDLYSLVYGEYRLDSASVVEEAAETLLGYSEAAMSGHSHRFSYFQWTRILKVLLAKRILSSRLTPTQISEVLDMDLVPLVIGKTTVHLANSKDITRFISRVVSRALSTADGMKNINI